MLPLPLEPMLAFGCSLQGRGRAQRDRGLRVHIRLRHVSHRFLP